VSGLHVAERRVPGAQATVIAVHGGLDRGGSFARIARRLSHLDLLTYDRRGYQGSRDAGEPSLDNHCDDLARLADYARERGDVVFFGHSYGGLICLDVAVHHPDLVSLVVTYEPSLPWILPRPGMSTRVLSTNPDDEAEAFFRRMVSDSAWERLGPMEQQSRRLDGPALLADLRTLRAAMPFNVADLKTPTTFVYGESANAAYYAAVGARLVNLSPQIRTESIEGAPHGAHLTHPDRLAAIIEQQWEALCASE